MRSRCALAFVFSLSVGLAGCGNAEIAPVKGRVMCNGKPVVAAMIIFSPTPTSDKDMNPGKPASGYTDDDGVFVLSTHRELDGAQIGQHNVNITLEDTNPAPCKKTMRTQLEVKPGQNDFSLEMNK